MADPERHSHPDQTAHHRKQRRLDRELPEDRRTGGAGKPQDEAEPGSLETKFVKNVKWIAGKRGFRNVVLHSFTHLADASAAPEFAEAFLQSAAARLRHTGYEVALTPFGWVCEWELAVFGESLAKVFKSL